ncbi:hypothetical protein OG345_42460 [Streptomyces sp. NBC_01220]|uniref:hypothetical protein n=1 Tax=unclassified Streptomyces TaxID=2593676 RepID=UPI0034299F28|nr:hypothetical protein OG345_42460 [Streptomyces sp. NBC_01220]
MGADEASDGFGEQLGTTAFLSAWAGLVAGFLTGAASLVIAGGDLPWDLIWAVALAVTAASSVLIWRKLEKSQAYDNRSDSGADHEIGPIDSD